MIVFLYGNDPYRLKQALGRVVSEYHKKYSGLAYTVLDMSERADFEKLTDLVKTVSFFDEKRLAVIKNPFALASKIMGLIKEWRVAADKDRIMVLVEQETGASLAKNDKNLFALLTAKPNLVQEVESLEGKKLESWVAKEVKQNGLTIEPAAVKKLLSCAGTDTWRLGQEVAKIANYCHGNGAQITAADVEMLVTPKEDLNIFQLVDAIAGRYKERAILLLDKNLESGQDPFYIFSMIVYQFRNLLRVKSLADNAVPYPIIIKKTGLNPFVVSKTYEQAKKYSLTDLKKLFSQLAQMDTASKSGRLDLPSAIFSFVFSLEN